MNRPLCPGAGSSSSDVLPSTVAIQGEKIMAVGGKEVLRDYRGTGSRVIDCQHGSLLPGFNDAHCHIMAYAASLLHLDISPRAASSIEEIKALLREKARTLPQRSWLTASGYDEFHLREKRHPLRQDLDAVVPDYPVRLIHRTGYACVLNSLALSLLNITVNTPEPDDGYIDRDSSGEPNGLLFGMKDYPESRIDPELPGSGQMSRALAGANKKYLSLGITSLQDATLNNDMKRWQYFQKIKLEGILASRITLMPGYRHLPAFLEQGFKASTGDHNLRLGAVKIVSSMARGRIYPEQAELEKIALDIHRAGFQIALHTLELETLEAGIKAIRTALEKYPRKDRRHRLEHCSLCPSGSLRQIRELNLQIVSQPAFVYYNGDRYLSTVSLEQIDWLYRIGSFHRAGIRVAFSSDSPVAEPDPITGIYSAVARVTEQGRDLLPLEMVTLTEALRMCTCEGAHASFEERVKGSISAGKLADLVLLKPGPLEVSLKNLRDSKVVLTIIGGKIVYEGGSLT